MGCTGSKKATAAAAPVPSKDRQLAEGEFKVTFERASDSDVLGLSIVDAAPGVFIVEAVKEEGLVQTFIEANESKPEEHITAGDILVAVNGVAGNSEQMRKELMQKTVVLTVKHPEAPPAEGATADTAAATVAVESSEAAPLEPVEPTATPAAEANTEGGALSPPGQAPTTAPFPAEGAGLANIMIAEETAETNAPVVNVQALDVEADHDERLCRLSMC
eukprot:TRINITY_DN93202_c0_g1_i1.p1 TRINITY_DN93202_c0_g1~~TRINITY_DN93202_c0_g1_i1.p1  ORF type:complete len:219 (-),score=54.86 TRINITY_DN93202_c0_g1_i1:294-950(-)